MVMVAVVKEAKMEVKPKMVVSVGSFMIASCCD